MLCHAAVRFVQRAKELACQGRADASELGGKRPYIAAFKARQQWQRLQDEARYTGPLGSIEQVATGTATLPLSAQHVPRGPFAGLACEASLEKGVKGPLAAQSGWSETPWIAHRGLLGALAGLRELSCSRGCESSAGHVLQAATGLVFAWHGLQKAHEPPGRVAPAARYTPAAQARLHAASAARDPVVTQRSQRAVWGAKYRVSQRAVWVAQYPLAAECAGCVASWPQEAGCLQCVSSDKLGGCTAQGAKGEVGGRTRPPPPLFPRPRGHVTWHARSPHVSTV